eukprot:TRINITY_DN2331_c0_g1_i1.p1 TRINITY_DN2331_c0_g1~~TRINITY_DN2331_c0_g1_i1.p1  ORF type:complete len:217 (-),score=63.34 TRINITY_DN2331_c0_g1_i1:3-653(-)
MDIEQRLGAITGIPNHEEEMGLQLHYTPKEIPDGRLTLGLHTDTNMRFFRCVTALIYLNDIPSKHEAETVFPLVNMKENSPYIEASKFLLQHDVQHTSTAQNPDFPRSIPKAADFLLESSIDPKNGMTIKPEAGKLVLFYSRDRLGNIDPWSWHGGASVLGTGKWTLQKFKEVPREFRDSEKEFRTFIESKYRIYAGGSVSHNYVVTDPNGLDKLD